MATFKLASLFERMIMKSKKECVLERNFFEGDRCVP